jgi:predicted LPLAT superfamily acyltransferase
MTEQQIIERIGTLTDMAEVVAQRQRVRAMQDYLHTLRDGEKQATRNWVNSSTLLFPEDFEDAMNTLSSDLSHSSQMLKQLDRIEAALNEQEKKLRTKCDQV